MQVFVPKEGGGRAKIIIHVEPSLVLFVRLSNYFKAIAVYARVHCCAAVFLSGAIAVRVATPLSAAYH